MGKLRFQESKSFLFSILLLSLHQQIIKNMIYDPETDRNYLNEFHLQNSQGCREHLKNQKPFSWEEVRAQYLRNKEKSKEREETER